MEKIVVSTLTSCMIPLTTLDKPEFKNMVNKLNPQLNVISYRTASRRVLSDLVKQTKNKIDALLAECCSVSVLLDLWTDRRCKSYIGNIFLQNSKFLQTLFTFLN